MSSHAYTNKPFSPPPAAGLLILALGLGVVAALLGMWSLALLAPLFAAACIAWPAAGAVALIAACALDRFAIGVGGPNVRLDELVALALAGALIARLWWRRGRPPRLPLLLPMLAYWAVNVLATVAAGGDVARGLSLDLITLDLILLYIALVWYLDTPDRLLRGVYLWLGVAAVEAIVGMLVFALYLRAHSIVFGVQAEPVTGAPMVYGTMYEANIFGSYMCAAFLLALALATEETTRRKPLLYAVCALTAIALLLSATRSAWGSTLVGVVLLLALLRLGQSGRRQGRVLRITGGLIAVAFVVGIGLAVAPSSVTGALGARAKGILNFASGSGYGRVQLYDEALGEWSAHPLLGLGPGSFTYRLPGDYSTGPAWLPNLTLQALHDTGVVGLLAMAWLFVAFYRETLRRLRRAPPGQARAVLAGLIAAVTALLICFQLTPGFLLGYSWALLAIGIAAAGAVASETKVTRNAHEVAA